MTAWGSMDEYVDQQPTGQSSSGDGGLPATGDSGGQENAERFNMAGSESDVMTYVPIVWRLGSDLQV